MIKALFWLAARLILSPQSAPDPEATPGEYFGAGDAKPVVGTCTPTEPRLCALAYGDAVSFDRTMARVLRASLRHEKPVKGGTLSERPQLDIPYRASRHRFGSMIAGRVGAVEVEPEGQLHPDRESGVLRKSRPAELSAAGMGVRQIADFRARIRWMGTTTWSSSTTRPGFGTGRRKSAPDAQPADL
jgi:hypothetical protein